MSEICDRKLATEHRQGFFRRNLFLMLAFLIPAVIMLTVFILRHYFPFGNRMILVIDSWHQYYPFLKEYQRLLKEGVLPFYSFNVGGGANFLGILANYLGSPLYLLTYFLPSGEPWLAGFLMFTVVIRIGCAGLFCAIFLRRAFKRNDLSIVYFSMMYALCAYILGYYWNMMWLDSVALLPLVIAGVVTVLRDKSFTLYVAALAMSILFNFYIGYFICFFVLIFSVCYTIITFASFKESIKNAGKMLLCSVLAVMLTAFVTIPAFLALQNSDSSGAITGFPLEYTVNTAYGYSDNSLITTVKAIARTVTNLLAYTEPIVFDKGLPNIACGVLSLTLLPFYFVTKKIKLREKIVSICLVIFFILSFVVNQLNYIWHGMSTPAMVYYRFSFIFSFVLVILAYRAFTLIDSFGKRTFIISSALLLVYVGVSLLFHRKLSVLITAIGAVIIIVSMILYRKKKLTKKVLSLILCLFVFCEMSLSAYYSVRTVGFTKNDDYPISSAAISEFNEIAASNSGDDTMYRTEFLSPETLNDPAIYSMFGISTFNSMCNSDYTDMMSELGLSASIVNNRYVYYESTPVTNMFLNIKYLIGREGEKAQNTAYLKEIATADECTLYENTAYIPMGFMTETALADFELSKELVISPEVQNKLFSLATGIDRDVFTIIDPITPVSCDKDDILTLRDGYDYCYYLDLREESPDSSATEDELMPVYAEYEITEDGSYYGVFNSSTAKVVSVTPNGDSENAVKVKDRYKYIASLGEYKAGDKLRVDLKATYGKRSRIMTYLAKFNDDVFEEGINKLSQNTMKITEKGNKHFTATINTDCSGLLYTSVLYDSGFNIYVDGEKTEAVPIGKTFSALRLEEGEHTIEFRYSQPGIHLGVTVSAVGVLILAIMLAVTFFKRRRSVEADIEADNAVLLSGDTGRSDKTDTVNAVERNEVESEIERIAEEIGRSDRSHFFGE